MALGQDNTETNYARLRDVKARLSAIDGTEALIEGFGDQSGRPARSSLKAASGWRTSVLDAAAGEGI